MTKSRWRVIALVCVVAVSVASARVVDAVAFGFGDKKGTLKIARQDSTQSTSSTTLAFLSGAATVIDTKKDGILLIRFAAKGLCIDLSLDGNCIGHVNIKIDGLDAAPSSSTVFMNSTGEGTLGRLSLAIDRSKHGLTKGEHTVIVYFAVGDAADSFSLDDMHLTVQAFRGVAP